MINGSERILYILDEFGYMPLGCLTSNSFNETVDLLDTTTRISNGWKTSRPTSQSFTVDFEGVQILNQLDKVSYFELKHKKRNRELLQFKISNVDGTNVEVFKGYIKELGEAANVDELITFSGLIDGFGEPASYADGIPTTFDSTIITFDNTNITFDTTD